MQTPATAPSMTMQPPRASASAIVCLVLATMPFAGAAGSAISPSRRERVVAVRPLAPLREAAVDLLQPELARCVGAREGHGVVERAVARRVLVEVLAPADRHAPVLQDAPASAADVFHEELRALGLLLSVP